MQRMSEETHHNLPPHEQHAFLALQKRQDIVIRQTDKGGSTVVQNHEDYLNEPQRLLLDKNTYVKLPRDPVT